MSDIEVIYTCPLGSTCEEVKDGKIHRCRWFVEMSGSDVTGQEYRQERKCTQEWNLLMMLEQSRAGSMHTQAIQVQTNENNKRQDIALQTMVASLSVQNTRNQIDAEIINGQ